jgi:hypothetical protein
MSPGTQFIGTSDGNVIPLPQKTKNFDQFSIGFARLDIDPFRISIPDANEEDSFCCSSNR